MISKAVKRGKAENLANKKISFCKCVISIFDQCFCILRDEGTFAKLVVCLSTCRCSLADTLVVDSKLASLSNAFPLTFLVILLRMCTSVDCMDFII